MNGKPSVWEAAEPEAPSDDCPPVGIYEDVPFEDYCKWDAVNQSRLKLLERSPEHYREAGSGEVSKALLFGELCHVAVLEPDELHKRFAVMPAYELDPRNVTKQGKQSKSKVCEFYKESKAAFEADAAEKGQTVVEQSVFDQAEATAIAVRRNELAVQFLNGQREVSIIWNDTATGIRCKARIDNVSADGLTDLKTCPDPNPHEFERSIWKYGYHRQAAWYVDGWESLTGVALPFRIVAVGKDAPLQCCAAVVDSLSVNIGRAENKEALAYLLECRQTQNWPGYENPVCWSLPAFVTDKYLEVGE